MRDAGLGLTTLLLGGLVQAASVSPAELAQCAAIAPSDTRLACYDALAHRVSGSPVSAPPGAAPAPGTAPVVRAAPTAPPPGKASPATPPEAVALDDPKNFGLSLNQLQRGQAPAPTAGLKSIKAHITSVSPGTPGHARIALDNDQTWDVLDDDGGLKAGLEVGIRKATLGSFLMSAAHHVYRVHRVN